MACSWEILCCSSILVSVNVCAFFNFTFGIVMWHDLVLTWVSTKYDDVSTDPVIDCSWDYHGEVQSTADGGMPVKVFI